MYTARPLGQLLVTSGLLSPQALEELLALQKTDPRRFGELLADKGLMRPHQLAQFLSHQLACPWVSLQRVEISREAVNVLPRELAFKHHMVPVHLRTSRGATALYVAMDDPTDEAALAEASQAATIPVKPMVALASEVRALLDRLYGSGGSGALLERGSSPAIESVPPSPFPPPTITKPRSLPVAPLVSSRPPKAPLSGSIPPAKASQPAASPDDLEEAEVIPDSRPRISEPSRRVYAKGDFIDGRYELLRDVGGAVAGSRWEAIHVRTARRCVLKIGVKSETGDESDADAVRRAHLALRRFQHPGAIDLRDAGATDANDPFIAVEMLEGRTLEGIVAARGALQPVDACALLRQVGEVLVAAHAAGVLHHEVRPEHVLVTRDDRGVERVKLVHWESATTTESAPEGTVDLAGLGACAFLALVGRPRDDGEDVAHLELPPALKGVVARAIGGANARRFGSAEELIEALEAAAPRRRDSLTLLRASPEKRASAAPPAKAPSDAAPAPASAPSSAEQRRYRRAAYRTPVRVDIAGVGPIDGRSEDISERGLFVVTRFKIADGAQVTVRFALPIDGKVVSEAGVVRWSRQASDARAVGIELMSPSPEIVKQIARYVALMG